jgi:hypothetical protein
MAERRKRQPLPNLNAGICFVLSSLVDGALMAVEVVGEGRDGHDFVGRRRRGFSLHFSGIGVGLLINRL